MANWRNRLERNYDWFYNRIWLVYAPFAHAWISKILSNYREYFIIYQQFNHRPLASLNLCTYKWFMNYYFTCGSTWWIWYIKKCKRNCIDPVHSSGFFRNDCKWIISTKFSRSIENPLDLMNQIYRRATRDSSSALLLFSFFLFI